ncbi:hypothetical protein [Streptomyces pseudoechinosporeus]
MARQAQSAPTPRIAACHMCWWVLTKPGSSRAPAASMTVASAGADSRWPSASMSGAADQDVGVGQYPRRGSMVTTVVRRKRTGRPGANVTGAAAGTGDAVAVGEAARRPTPTPTAVAPSAPAAPASTRRRPNVLAL